MPLTPSRTVEELQELRELTGDENGAQRVAWTETWERAREWLRAKLDGYIEHRLDRERRLVSALERGLRTEDELLDAAWSDAPAELRRFAALSLRSHLEKLRSEGRA